MKYHATDQKQLRDFIYVKDVIEVCLFLMKQTAVDGVYNLGAGKARTFLDLADATFKALGRESNIEFIGIPSDIRENYQYYTEAPMDKLRAAGYSSAFSSLEDGVAEYVKDYLVDNKYM